ncbi:hypothetical protein AAE478_008071 [Parahypoxylon ruwenzoriense]
MPARKRTAAEATMPETSRSSRRRSQRISTSAKKNKSAYFEDVDDDDDIDLVNDDVLDDGSEDGLRSASSLKRRAATKTQAKTTPGRKRAKKAESDDELQSQYGDDGDVYEYDEDNNEGDSADDDEYEANEPTPPPVRKRARGRPPKQRAVTAAKSKAKSQTMPKNKTEATLKAKAKAKVEAKVEPKEPNYKEDSDDEEDDEIDEEDRITYLPVVELRDTGGVEYEDTQIHPNTLLFLKDLKANNYRSWLKTYDDEYRRSLKDWESFAETLTDKIIEADDTIPELPIKDVVFRIYRDIRFSNDPTPSRTGRKGPYACYYVHVEPGRCMVGGGLWHPDKGALARMRASIDERPHRIRRVLTNPAFRQTFLPAAKGTSEKAVLAAFAAANQEGALKTKPKGFHPDHRDIALLKLRNFTIGKTLDDADFTAADAQDKVMDIIKPMVEFVSFVNSIVMPDPNLDDNSSGDEGGGAGDQEEEEEEEEA